MYRVTKSGVGPFPRGSQPRPVCARRRPPLPVERLLHQPEHPLLAAGFLGQGFALVAGLQAPPVDEVALARPGVVLVAAHRPDQAHEGLRRREHLDHPRAPLDLAVHALLDVVRPHPVPVLPGERGVGEGRGRGLLEGLGAALVHGGEQVDGAAVARPPPSAGSASAKAALRAATAAEPSPFPCGSAPSTLRSRCAMQRCQAAPGRDSRHGPDEALVGVRDDEAHAREPAGPERQQEAAPGEVRTRCRCTLCPRRACAPSPSSATAVTSATDLGAPASRHGT